MKNGFVFSLVAVCLAVLAFSQSSPQANVGGPYNGAPSESISFNGSQSTAPTGQSLTFAWSFGDGATGTGVNPTHSYSASGVFTVSLTVTASGGGTNTVTTTATIATAPTAKTGGPYTGVANQTITFNGSASTGPSGLTLTYAWDFGDGSSATGVTPTHAYLLSGTYTVTLTVVDPLGGSNSATTNATILSANSPVANTGGPYTGTIAQSLTFNASASTGPSGLTYSWSFGDGSTATGVAPTHTYTATGSYTVTLTVAASGVGSNTAKTTATILTAPAANAGGPYNASAGQPTTFSGASSTGPSGQTLTYSWQFGDGSTGTGVSPTHTYAAAGTFTVSLTVSDGFGVSNAATATATIIAAPVANAGGPYNWTAGSALSFSGSASTAPSGQTLSYSWNFGDGGTATGATTTHTYSTPGTFSVSLTVTDTSGGTNTASVSAVIAAAPAANAGGPYNQIPAQAITFNGSKSSGPSGQTLSYAWNFGDGATGTGVNPTHAYAAAGTYTVSLTVTDPIGGTNAATSTANVASGPLANAGGTYTGTVTQPIAFNAASSTGPSGQTLTYAWNFGDGTTGTGVNPTHAYATTGSFTVSLTVSTSGGGSNTTTTTATAVSEPIANAGGSYTGTVSQALSFNASKSIGPAGQTLSQSWNFGDGTTGTGLNPTHTYTAVGSYNVTLTVSDSVGGSSISKTTAVILSAPVANAGGPYSGTAAQSLTLNGSLSTAPPAQILSYAWNFGDGGAGTGVNPTHTYSTAGSYSVTLTLTDSSGGSSTATTTATIGKSNTPVANAGGPYNGTAGALLTLSAAASTGPTGQPLTYQWNFGDGSTGTGVNPTHSYRSTGSYTVAVTVATNNGASSTASTTASIASTPVANAGGPYNERPGTPVAFNGSKSTAPSGQTLTYAWTFGDGATGTGANTSHSYIGGGNYTVSLTVTDGIGGTSTATTTATIGNGPVAQPGGPYAGPPAKAIAFNGANSTAPSGQTLTYDWSFGDGSTATGVSPSHSYSVAGTYNVSLTVIDSVGESNTSSVAATITNSPVANAGGPYTSLTGQTITFNGANSTGPQGQTLSYNWNFGDGGTGSGISPTHSYNTAGTYTVSLTLLTSGGLTSAPSTATAAISPPLSLSSFSPTSGPIGTIITLNGEGLLGLSGSAPIITLTGSALNKGGFGTVTAPINSASATSVSFVIPPGATSGLFSVTAGSQTARSAGTISVASSSDFALAVSPASSKLIPGQPSAITVSPTSTNGFNGLANLSITGVPPGITAAFNPTTVSVGQVSLLTLTAPQGQSGLPISLVVNASANIDGQPVTHSAPLTIQVTGISTSFVGRTVVDDSLNTPIAGVTVTFLGVDATGRTTGCSGHTISDTAGNFSLTNLPASCVGPQLIAYNGSTATAPAGKYAGVNLSYTLAANQVTASPILIHLPRIDNANQVNVQQNASTDQMYAFPSIPGLVVVVYAGTTLSLDDGSQPNPFPLVAVQVPVDRLPDQMATSGMVMPFIVAFQPANAVASQPVAVNFPNSLNNAPGSPATLMTLDPTHGYMVPYGTATVSNNGTLIIADADPSHPGHNYGLVHFDWHGPAATPQPNGNNPGPNGCKLGGQCDPSPKNDPDPDGTPPCDPNGNQGSDCSQGQDPTGGDPVDLSSGLHVIKATDISIRGERGSISIRRIYRSLTTNDGPFGLGSQFQYSWALATNNPNAASAINLVSPDGNQYLFSRQADGTLTNSSVPWLQGAVMTTNSSNQTTLRLYDGTIYTFNLFKAICALVSIADSNGNTVQLTQNPNLGPMTRITQITDPVGRSLTLSYDSNAHVTSVTDSIGRSVTYTYNSSGTLATVTNAAGGVTTMNYDSQNRLVSMVDPRTVTMFQDSFDANNRVTSQTLADGSVISFSYVTLNPALSTSPIALASVTDGRGNQTTYRFNFQSFVIGVTDALGQTKTFARDPLTNNILQVTGSAQCPICGPPGRGSMTYTYDAQGNRLTATDALGNTTTYTYEPIFNKVISVTDALNHTTKYAYDGAGNLTKTTDANGNVTQYTYDSTGLLLTTIDALNNVTKITYDTFGNPSTITDALSNVTKFVYDPVSRPISITDPIGRTSSIGYDALNRIVAFKDGRGSFTQFSLDPVGNLLTLTDPKNNQTQFTYDPLRRLSTRTSPIGKVESYQYDLAGNSIKYTDRRGQVSTYQYDTLNRLVQETYQDGAVVTRSYDPYSRLLNVNDSVGGLFTFGYDVNGRLLSQTSPTGVIKYTRDALHRVLTRQVIGQGAVTYAYDPVGNLLSAVMPGAGITYTYDARNMEKTAMRTNNVGSAYTYDALGHAISLVHSRGTTAINTQLYAHDASGNRQSAASNISQSLITQATAATVDQANELLTNGSTTYTSDANGNRLTETTAGKTIQYRWDGRNRLAAITDAQGNVTSFKYDFMRNLIVVNTVTSGISTAETFLSDNVTNVASFTGTSGLPMSILSGNSLDAHIASIDSAGNANFRIDDILGNTSAMTNRQGILESPLYYEPYGYTTGATPTAFPFAFTGRVPVYSSIYYYRNRYYDVVAGRFIDEDPLGFSAGDSNLYPYAGSNPVNLVDPRGTSWVGQGVSTLAFIAGLILSGPVGVGVGAAALAYGYWDEYSGDQAAAAQAAASQADIDRDEALIMQLGSQNMNLQQQVNDLKHQNDCLQASVHGQCMADCSSNPQ